MEMLLIQPTLSKAKIQGMENFFEDASVCNDPPIEESDHSIPLTRPEVDSEDLVTIQKSSLRDKQD
jgi:hypothetical protein